VTGNLPPGLNLPALADPMATTVIYMGKRTFPALAEALIAHGLPPETPALLAESVSTPEQLLHRSTVAALAARLAADRSTLPGLILVGPLAEGVAN
jgi:uroporphyrin-III C-methyltransferase